MSREQINKTFRLPSLRLVKVEREQNNDSVSCVYVDENGRPLSGVKFSDGVSLTGEFLSQRCTQLD